MQVKKQHLELDMEQQTGSKSGNEYLPYLPEFAQTHVHRLGDAIQPPHTLSFPSPPAFNVSQHQGLFK